MGGYIIVNQQNSGVSSARNNGLAHASGQYVWFIDSDDIIAPNSLALIDKEISKTAAPILTIKRNTVEQDFKYSPDSILALQNADKPQGAANVAYNYIVNRDYLTRNGITFKTGMAYGEDHLWCFWINFFNTSKIPTIHRTIYFYRLRAGSAMHTKTAESAQKHLSAMLTMLDTYVDALHRFEADHDSEKITNIKARISWSVDNVLMDAVRLPRKECLELYHTLQLKGLITRRMNWNRVTLSHGYKNFIFSVISLPIKNKAYFSLLNHLLGK